MAPPGTFRKTISDPLVVLPHQEEQDHNRLAKIRRKVLKGHSDAVTSCHLCFDDTKIISGSYDSTVKLWDISQRAPIQTFLEEHSGPISECCLSPDNRRLITVSYDKTLKTWDIETGKVLWSVEQDNVLTSCDVSHDGKYIVCGSDIENAICLVDAENAEQVAYVREHHRSTVRRCRFDPYNQRIATVSSDMSIKFWDILAQSTTITVEKAHTNAISDCCFSLDGHYLCTAGWDEVLKLWDVRTGEFRSHGPIVLEQGHLGIIGCCIFSKDASLLVSGGFDKTVVVWDSTQAYKKISLKGHDHWVTDVAISSNKKLIVTSSKDSTLRLWDIENANDVPVVIHAIKARGSKIAKCEECEKPFLIFQEKEEKVETRCLFCRLKAYKSVLPVPPSLPADL
ncbi:WD repeat-containing protein 88 [Sphaerodactylus townsendi]|uniref:WD repeat-containing protein 88 n=1 Tax=Sphaerodactylus townsendi TaxID=933632 RepID=UPI0020260C04|nr:WD repeat-containing protein 88 [Sphaerodactylus townsendi]